MKFWMYFWMYFCLFLSIVYSLLGGVIDPQVWMVAILFAMLAIMFWYLSKTPKGSKFILGYEKGIEKKSFILGSVGLAFGLMTIGMLMCEYNAFPEYIYIYPIVIVSFLILAVIIDYVKNPAWRKYRGELKIRNAEIRIEAEKQRIEEEERLKRLKKEYEDLQSQYIDDFDDYDFEDDDPEDDEFTIDMMEGHDFEYFCAELLKKNGFSNVSVTKASGDQGVDILAEKDGIKYAVQCKNYMSHLGNTPIQEVGTGKIYYNCHVGVVMTNSTFTQSAQELAKATGVLLWDRGVVLEMMKKVRI